MTKRILAVITALMMCVSAAPAAFAEVGTVGTVGTADGEAGDTGDTGTVGTIGTADSDTGEAGDIGTVGDSDTDGNDTDEAESDANTDESDVGTTDSDTGTADGETNAGDGEVGDDSTGDGTDKSETDTNIESDVDISEADTDKSDTDAADVNEDTADTDDTDTADTDTGTATDEDISGTDTSEADSDTDDSDISIEEAIERVNEMYDSFPRGDGIHPVGIAISEEDQALIDRVLTYDITGEDQPGTVIEVYSDTYESKDGSTDYYYSKMTTEARQDYNRMVSGIENMLTSDTNFSTNAFCHIELAHQYSIDDFHALFSAVEIANPQFFYIDSLNFSYSRVNGSDQYVKDVNIFALDICQKKSDRTRYKNQIDSLASTWLSKMQGNDFRKVYTLSDLICQKVYYQSNPDREFALSRTYDQGIISVFCMDHTICKGYAAAFSYMCSLAGIDCITVYSFDHAWNRVKIGGKWYEHDVTWYDSDDGDYDIDFHTVSTKYIRENDNDNMHDPSTDKDIGGSHAAVFTDSVIPLPACNTFSPLAPTNIKAITGGSKNDTEGIGNGNIKITWDPSPYASEYIVGYTIDGGDAEIETVKDNYYILRGLETGAKVEIVVVGVYKDLFSPISGSVKAVAGVVHSPVPKLIPGNGKVNITWSPSKGADSYRIYTVENGQNKFIREVRNCGANIDGLTNGRQYKFFVKAVAGGAHSPEFTYATCTPRNFGIPVTLEGTGKGTFTVKWKAFSGASKYRVVCVDPDGTVRGTRDTAKLEFKWMGLTDGKKYGFYVLPYVNGTFPVFIRTSAADKAYITYGIPVSSPTVTGISCGNKKVSLSWSKVTGATAYYIYYKDASGTEKSVRTSGTSGTVTGLTNGRTYTFYVKALANGKLTTQKNAVTAVPRNYNTSVTATAKGSGNIYLSWKAVSGASKYRVVCIDGSTLTTRETTGKAFSWAGKAGKRYGFYIQPCISGHYVPFDRNSAEDKTYVTYITAK